ncbi:S41 family peptidase [uncultured Flavobacterium sp.]|uniref:S41 family peptidase n=1 Tax=uncultured Flavobacterium sp. TaxID=165435 RepID=UPI0030EBA68B
MKKILFLIFPLFVFGQTNKTACETLFQINEVIQERHYKPKALNDSLSKYVFTAFLSELDENNRLFLASDINTLKKHQYKIDDYIKDKDCQFLEDIFKVYTIALARNNKIYSQLEKEITSFESTETILFSKEPYPYVSDEIELKKRIKKSTLFQILKNIAETSKNKDSLVQNFSKLSLESKKKLFELNKCKSAEFNFDQTQFNSKFFNVFCSYFDPHTSFFSNDDKSNFLSSVSSNDLSYGLMVSLNDNEEITIENIVPGSSAYFSDIIEIGDQIIKIKANNESFEISCATKDKVETIFNSSDIKKADFTLRKKSGEIYKVSLDKNQLTNYSTSLYSFILKKENKKIGYIKIPSFYGEVGSGQTNVSDDLAKEIYKLKKDGIDGLIVDVQNNGGGSMIEAINITGMFIDIGPVAILNDKQNKVETVRDPNRGSIYTGPLVVLVNAYSASASEFFANAIQDYERGIIVGSKTRGKASMQTILPLNSETNDSFIKVTIEGFYRITGKSNQSIGTIPDVEIPFLFDNQIKREENTPNALQNDEVVPKMRFSLFNNPKKNEVILKSKSRIKLNNESNKIIAMNNKIDAIFDFNFEPIPLDFNAVYNEVDKINSTWREIKTLTEIQFPIEIEQSQVEIEYQQFDEFVKSSNLEKTKAIKSNLHIFEAINIINDLTQ